MESKRVLDKAFSYMDAHFSGSTYFPGSMEWDRCLSQARYYYACRRREYLSWFGDVLRACFTYPEVGAHVSLKPSVMLRNNADRVQALVLDVCGWSAAETEALLARYGGESEFEVCSASDAYPFRIGVVGAGGYYEYIPAILFRGYFGSLVLDSELVEELLDESLK